MPERNSTPVDCVTGVTVSSHHPRPGDFVELSSFCDAFIREERSPGLALGIVRGDELVYCGGFGTMIVGDRTKLVSDDTIFHMSSLTKSVVATAIMQLVEAKKVILKGAVSRYLPYFRLADSRYDSITILHLLTHTSGLPDVRDYFYEEHGDGDGALERHVRNLHELTLHHQPGAKFTYSSLGFDILGDVVSKASGRSFEDYVEANILRPLNMNATALVSSTPAEDRLATGHSPDDTGAVVSVCRNPLNRSQAPSSGILSNVTDMARWIRLNLNHGELNGRRVLAASTHAMMWRPIVDTHRAGLCSGIGWFLTAVQDEYLVEHGGHSDGFICHLTLLPNRRTGFVVMANYDYARILRVREQVLKIVTGWEVIPPIRMTPLADEASSR